MHQPYIGRVDPKEKPSPSASSGFNHTCLCEFCGWTLSSRHSLLILEIIEERYGSRSTIISSQLPPEKWYERVKDPTIADAILDRIVHNAYRIELSGGSMRKSMREVYSKIDESDNKNTNEKERE
ncbi:MAG: hypothetical protein GQ565_10710 [Candidatus Aegiribacteria sp.]|nr:hypothetical protein [Candidatus Aegiribacteria sp.]